MNIRTTNTFRFALFSAASFLALQAGTALADKNAIDEIIITAEKRSESLQDVPVAVTAFQAGELEAFDFTDPGDMAAQVPNLQVSGAYNQSKPIFALRGISFKSFNATDSQAVGVYNDEVFIASRSAQLFQMFDLQRVEVLRGPQGTLYGKNTTGGAINFVSRKPDDTFAVDGALTLGRFNQFDAEVGVTLPIVEGKLTSRVAAVTNNRGGTTLNEYTGKKVNSRDDWAARALFRFTPNDNMEWLLNVHGGVSRGDGSYYHSKGVIPTGDGRKGDILGYVENPDWYTLSSDLPRAFENINNIGVTLTGNIDFSDVTLTSITAYDKTDYATHEDSDGSPNSVVDVIYRDHSKQFSQELRLSSSKDQPFQWIFGLYYFTEKLTADNYYNFGIIDPTAFSRQVYDQRTDNFAGFGQVSYDLTDKLTATAGARWTYEKKKITFDTTDFLVFTLGPTPELLVDASDDNSWDEFTWRLGLDYHITNDALVYASYNRGFKSGGYNGIVFTPGDFSVVNPETVDAYEVGLKSTWFERRLVLNIAAFYNDFSNLQLFNFVPGPGGVPITQIVNAASARTYGAEFEVTAIPVEGLRVQMGLGLLNAKLQSFDIPDLTYLEGHKMALAPNINFNGAIDYELQLGENSGSVTPRFEFNYVDDQYFDPSNDPLAFQKGYWVLNASLTYRAVDNRYAIIAWAKNFNGKKYLTESLPFTDFGLYEQKHNDRPSFGLTLRFHLN